MHVEVTEGFEKSRLAALLEHLGDVPDPREPWRVAHPLPEVLLLVVCGTICDCDDYELSRSGASATSSSFGATCPMIMAFRVAPG